MEVVDAPLKGGRAAAAARPLRAQEPFHAELPLLCVATDVRHEALLCRQCLAPLGRPADHVRAVAPELLESDELRPLADVSEARELCVAAAGSCARCDARFCGECVARDAQAAHVCAGVGAVRDRWPKLGSAPRFRLFVKALGLVTSAGEGAAAAAAAIETLCRPALPSDGNTLAVAAFEAELAEPLAQLHCALARERLARAAADLATETALETSAAIARMATWCTPTGYRNFERRVATNAHGLRFTSPAGSVLAAAIAASPTLSAAAQETVLWAVAGVGDECELPFYCATALFATASALNHSCRPSCVPSATFQLLVLYIAPD